MTSSVGTGVPDSATPRLGSPNWARSILPAPTLASRQWSQALARRCREPSQVNGFIEPASLAHHILMPLAVGFAFEARELGTGRWRHYDVRPGELCVVGAGAAPMELCWRALGGTGSNGSAFIGLWSRDAATDKYRAYYFMAPTGDVVVLNHEWREDSQSFVGSAELGGGMRMLAEDRFHGRDEYEWSITVQDNGGKILTRMRGHERRAH